LTRPYAINEKRDNENENQCLNEENIAKICYGKVTCDRPNDQIYNFKGTSDIIPN
jgi:hypothetical protein